MSMDNEFLRAITKLVEEKNNWQKDHPENFTATVVNNPDGSLDVMTWSCIIPGKAGTRWEGGIYRLYLLFSDRYPNVPPKCLFDPPIFHPNISSSGIMYIPILSRNMDWRPSLTVKDILLKIQQSLDEPYINDSIRNEACDLYKNARHKYNRRVREQAQNFREEKLQCI